MAYTANVYKPKDVSAPLPEFNAMRARLQQKTNADTQQQQDAMQRRLAAQGGLNTGTAIKQAQIIADQGAQRVDEGNQAINDREQAERRRMQEVEDQRAFQSQEAEQGRAFAGNEAEIGRQFTAKESQLGREHARGMFDDNQKFEDKWRTIGQSNTIRQLDMQAQELAFNKNSALSQMDDDELERFANSEAVMRGNPNATAEDFRAYNAWKKAENERLKERDSQKFSGGQNYFSRGY